MNDLLILGAGAAGLMAAMIASSRGARVVVVDHAPVIGRKMRLAGGGKGNVTNLHMTPAWFVSNTPEFVGTFLKKLPPRAVLALLENFDIPVEEREYGQIFCTVPAARLVEAMTARCRASDVQFMLRHSVQGAEQAAQGFVAHVQDSAGRSHTVNATRLLLALGSPAFPSCGATDAGLAIARRFGHTCVPFRPALVPFILPEKHPLHGLQGISVCVTVTVGSHRIERVPLLFTHKGISGPAALHASCLWHAGQTGQSIEVNFLPEHSVLKLMHDPENGRQSAIALLKKHMPQRLAETLYQVALEDMCAANVPHPNERRGVAEWSKPARCALERVVHHWVFQPLRTEGMGKAEAAAGGVRTEAICPRTLESQLVPGLFFAGEVLDVVGLLGGYNLHWAFATGQTVGRVVAESVKSEYTS